VSVAALKGEALMKQGKAFNQFHDRRVDCPEIQSFQYIFSIVMIPWICSEFPCSG